MYVEIALTLLVVLLLIVMIFYFASGGKSTTFNTNGQEPIVTSDADIISEAITIPGSGTTTYKLKIPQGWCCHRNTIRFVPITETPSSGELSYEIGTTNGGDDIRTSQTIFSGQLSIYNGSYGGDSFDESETCAPVTDKTVYIKFTSTYATAIKILIRHQLRSIELFAGC